MLVGEVAMTEREAKRRSDPVARGPEAATPVAGGRAGSLLSLQRSAGNRATVASLGIRRKIAAADTTADPDMGPSVEIGDSALTPAQKATADEAMNAAKAGTALEAIPWAAKRIKDNGGKVPGSVKKFKWGVVHHNRDGYLPGKKGAGGYKEYYIRSGVAETDGASAAERLCISNSTGDVFHTATHYGDKGKPAFTHYA